jgi:long-chain acyl-CoA synthetase
METKSIEKFKKNDFKNFSEVLNHWANEALDKIFIYDLSLDKSYTYAKFNKLVNATVRLLEEQGVKIGDIISVCIRNSSEFLMIYFASIRLGCVINPLPSSLSEEEIIKHLDFTQSKIIFLEKENSVKVFNKYNVFVIDFKSEDSFLNKLKNFSDKNVYGDYTDLNENNLVCLYYSSGTTSDPKGILYSHKNMMNMISSVCKEFNHGFDTVHLGILSMGHTAIINYSFLPVMYVGGTLVIVENFIKIRPYFWDIIEKYKVTYVETVPTILLTILNTNYPNYSKEKINLQYVGCGSAPLPLSIQKDFQKKFDLPVANLYGLSETGPNHFDNPLKENWKPGSIGFPLNINECKIVDNEFNELPVNEVGEIVLKGQNLFVGYFNNEIAYKKVMKNGFFLTGDLGYKDEEGRFFLC